MKVCIVIPAYNEEKRIGKTLEEYGKFFAGLKKQKKLDFEVVIVINNTKDRTEDVVKEYSKKYKEIRYLNFREGGKGFAITEGFKYALKRNNDFIGFVDADMATSPKEFYDLIENINNYKGIIASRWLKNSVIKGLSIKRKILSRGFNFIVRSLFLFPYKDTQCGAKLFTKEVVEKITPDLRLTQWAFDINILYLCKRYKFKVKEYPTVWDDKEGSGINIINTPIQMLLGAIRLRLIFSFFEPLLRPIKFILRIGTKLLS